MFQGGFKLGPQSVTQPIWDVRSRTLVPETSKSFDAGYRAREEARCSSRWPAIT